jgi:hypothetical protein
MAGDEKEEEISPQGLSHCSGSLWDTNGAGDFAISSGASMGDGSGGDEYFLGKRRVNFQEKGVGRQSGFLALKVALDRCFKEKGVVPFFFEGRKEWLTFLRKTSKSLFFLFAGQNEGDQFLFLPAQDTYSQGRFDPSEMEFVFHGALYFFRFVGIIIVL